MNDLGPALQGIADTVATVIDPNYKFKQAMRNKLATDPDLIRQLSATEDAAPGTLEAMGFGKQLTSIIRKAPIPEKDLIEKNLRPAVEKATKQPEVAESAATQRVANVQPGQVKEDITKGQIAQTGSDFIKASPENANIVGAVSTTGARPFQLQNEQSGLEATSSANAWLQTHQGATIPDIVKGFFDKSIPANVMSGLFNIPSYGAALKSALDAQLDQERVAAQLKIGMARTAAELNDATYRRKYALWGPTAIQIGANPDAIIAYMDDPKVQERGIDLAAHPEKIKTEEDRVLARIAQGLQSLNSKSKQELLAQTSDVITDLLGKQIVNEQKTENDPAITQELVGQINAQLTNRAKILGVPKYTAIYGKPPGSHFYNSKRIYFVDEKGKLVEDQVATSPTIFVSDKEKVELAKIYSNLVQLPDDSSRTAALSDLKKQAPDMYNKLTQVYPIEEPK